MPEGPEICMACRFVNNVCRGKYFSGKVEKSAISKCPDLDWDVDRYQITANYRGKELKLTLTEVQDGKKQEKRKTGIKLSTMKSSILKKLDVVFKFGLTGKFKFDSIKNLEKHAHLNFLTKDKDDVMALSFVDTMRFGTWKCGDWGKDRGPCVLQEYDQFRINVLENLEKAAFNKPICETLLNQKYFNGIGNYLRAEILYRAGVQPFDEARTVLEPLTRESTTRSTEPDILELCHQLSTEVINLPMSAKNTLDDDNNLDVYADITDWLQCYFKPSLNNMADHNGRTIWYAGEPGPLVPKNAKQKHKQGTKKKVPKKAAVEISTSDTSNKRQKTQNREDVVDDHKCETKNLKRMTRSTLTKNYEGETNARRTRSKKK